MSVSKIKSKKEVYFIKKNSSKIVIIDLIFVSDIMKCVFFLMCLLQVQGLPANL